MNSSPVCRSKLDNPDVIPRQVVLTEKLLR